MSWLIEPLQVLIDDLTCIMKILSVAVAILYNSEIFAGIVNYVGTKMDLRLAVRIAYVELQSLSKA